MTVFSLSSFCIFADETGGSDTIIFSCKLTTCSGTLQHYDARVDYATVYVSLREVARLSNVEEPATGFGAQLAAAFSSGWKHFVSGVQDLAVALEFPEELAGYWCHDGICLGVLEGQRP